jgi:hypothetical protein
MKGREWSGRGAEAGERFEGSERGFASCEHHPVSLLAIAVVVAIAFVPTMVVVAPLFLWTRWLGRLATAPALASRISYTLLGLASLVTVFSAVESVRVMSGTVPIEPGGASPKARLLARGIAEAFYSGTFALLVAAVAALWLLFATWRWRWSTRKSQ